MPRAPPPPLPPKRMDVVEAAWHKVAGGNDSVSVDGLKAAYDATRHPRVLDGVMSIAQAKDVVARAFDRVADGTVTWEEFLQYHVRMSAEIDRSRAVDRDASFVHIVVQQWRLDKDPDAALQPTGVIPSTLECPTGLKQTKNMDLVWNDPSGARASLHAFRGAVKTRFGRAILPANIRGYFAFADELTDFTVKACTARSALLSPLSIVWVDEQSNHAVGFKEVISPNIDLAQLPDDLRAVVMSHDDAEKQHNGHVEWLPLVAPFNPMYTKSSEAFGQGAADQAQEVLALKRKVWEGTNCGVAWHGHTGKFTDGFNGGPQRASGLNTASRRARV